MAKKLAEAIKNRRDLPKQGESHGAKGIESSDAELGIMRCLWENGPSSARQLTGLALRRRDTRADCHGPKAADATGREECVSRNRETWPHLFAPAVAREEVITDQLQQTASRLCDGALSPLLTNLVKSGSLSEADRKSLRALLDDLDTPNP